jgi:major membrane immunogen (membrane-anchored lipoprotein)
MLALCALAMSLSACFQSAAGMQDGYFTAEAADFDEYGWKEYVLIYVSMGRIITAEYDAFNRSGFAKSWDIDYMRTMVRTDGTYPSEFTRIYADALVLRQDPSRVDMVAGATRSHIAFQQLAAAAIDAAEAGDVHVVLLDLNGAAG